MYNKTKLALSGSDSGKKVQSFAKLESPFAEVTVTSSWIRAVVISYFDSLIVVSFSFTVGELFCRRAA